MEYHFTNDKPIYVQIVEYFKIQIVSGLRPQGSRVESVRDLAVEAKVNPNTMQKALSELERLGLVKTERTSGRFITDDKEKIAAMREEIAGVEVKSFIKKMRALGFEKKEIKKMIDQYEDD